MSDDIDNALTAVADVTLRRVTAADPESGGGGDGHLSQQTGKEEEKDGKHGGRTASGPHPDPGHAAVVNPSVLLQDEASLTHSARAVSGEKIAAPAPVPAPVDEDLAASAPPPPGERVHFQAFA
jgi:hypothetical protein